MRHGIVKRLLSPNACLQEKEQEIQNEQKGQNAEQLFFGTPKISAEQDAYEKLQGV